MISIYLFNMPTNSTFKFLVDSAVMLHRYGTPSHRLERVMTKVAASVGIQGQFLYTPTALVISLANDSVSSTVVRRVDSVVVDVDKLIRFDDLLGKVELKEISIDDATIEMQRIDKAPSLYPQSVYILACAAACACVAVLFRGSSAEIIASGGIGLVIAFVELLHQRWRLETGLLEPVSGMIAAILALCTAHYLVQIDDRLVTLSGLIVLIPGLRLTVGLTELAVGHLSAGVARLAGAMVSLCTMFVGVAIVWRIASGLRSSPEPIVTSPEYWQWIALSIAPIAFAIVFRAAKSQWPIIASVSILGVVVSPLVEPRLGIEAGAFFASLCVGCGSNLYARIRDRPALVPLTPGMLILVPGSVGYRSLASLLEYETVEGVQFAFATLLIGASLVGGLLVSNAIVPPKRIL